MEDRLDSLALLDCHQIRFVRQRALHIFRIGVGGVVDAAEHDYFFEILRVGQDTKALVADVAKPERVKGVLDSDPDLLVEKEQMQIVEKRSTHLSSQIVVATARDHNCTADWKVIHRVTVPRGRRETGCFQRNELCICQAALCNVWSQASKLVVC